MKNIIATSAIFKRNHPWYFAISLIILAYEIFSGSKVNKTLLLYSTISTLMLARMMPEHIQIKNPFYPKL
jgi:hypothetical protein